MNFFINEFSILSPTEKKAFNQKFKENINLIIGEKDSGKSSLVRSMLYTLGCDVRSFDFLKSMPENTYIIDFDIDRDNYIIIRRSLKRGRGKNFFKIIKNKIETHNFYDTTKFKDYLNLIMGIELITTNKENKETKLYPNHIFLPFYTDQDFSWQNYLSATFTGVPFIQNYKKIILEYFTGARSNEYYRLQLKKTELKSKLLETEALIKSKELIIRENDKNIKIIESIDVESFQKQYEYTLAMYRTIIETEHKLKRELNEKIYRKNSLLEMKSKISSSIEDIIDDELNDRCPNCRQKIYKELEENYKLLLTQQNLIKEREKINLDLKDIEDEINESMCGIQNIKHENRELTNKLNADSKVVELSDRANSYALNKVNSKLLSELEELKVTKILDEKNLEKIEGDLNKLNKNDVSKDYKELMITAFKELEIPFSYKNYYVSNLESANIMLSGASKVQAFIAQYLSIYEMTLNAKDTIDIPIFIDTFLKDDFNEVETYRTSKYIFDTLKDKFQSFIFISNNEQTIESIANYDYHEIRLLNKESLLNKDYDLIYDKYKDSIIEE